MRPPASASCRSMASMISSCWSAATSSCSRAAGSLRKNVRPIRPWSIRRRREARNQVVVPRHPTDLEVELVVGEDPPVHVPLHGCLAELPLDSLELLDVRLGSDLRRELRRRDVDHRRDEEEVAQRMVVHRGDTGRAVRLELDIPLTRHLPHQLAHRRTRQAELLAQRSPRRAQRRARSAWSGYAGEARRRARPSCPGCRRLRRARRAVQGSSENLLDFLVDNKNTFGRMSTSDLGGDRFASRPGQGGTPRTNDRSSVRLRGRAA